MQDPVSISKAMMFFCGALGSVCVDLWGMWLLIQKEGAIKAQQNENVQSIFFWGAILIKAILSGAIAWVEDPHTKHIAFTIGIAPQSILLATQRAMTRQKPRSPAKLSQPATK